MALDFGPHADVVFKRAPLRTVLCQVKFPPVLSLLTPAGVAGFQAAVRDEYPTLLPLERTASVSLSPESFGVSPAPPVWRFTNADRKWTVGLSSEFISLETSSYAGIDGFLDRLGMVLAALRRTVRPAESTRVGLRKVNAIPAPDPRDTYSLLGIVRPELLGLLAVPVFPAPIAHYLSHLVFKDDFSGLAVRCALNSPDEVTTHLMLDLDYFTEQPYTVAAEDALLGLLRHFSDGTTNFFHWAVTDDYKESLGPFPRDESTGGS